MQKQPCSRADRALATPVTIVTESVRQHYTTKITQQTTHKKASERSERWRMREEREREKPSLVSHPPSATKGKASVGPFPDFLMSSGRKVRGKKFKRHLCLLLKVHLLST